MILLTTPQQPVELILMRRLAASLALPVVLVDAAGYLVFANEYARALLGPDIDDELPIPPDEFRRTLRCRDESGHGPPDGRSAVGVALAEQRPAHRSCCLAGIDGEDHRMAVTAVPLRDATGSHLGTLALLWEDPAR